MIDAATKQQLDNMLTAVGKKIIPTMEFNEMLKNEVDMLDTYFKKNKSNSYMPHLNVYSITQKNGKRELLYVAFADMPEENRHKMIWGLGHKIGTDTKMELACIFLITEAWFSPMEKDEKGEVIMPRNSDKKQEAFMVAGLTLDGRTNFVRVDINRDGKKNIQLGKKHFSFVDDNSGNKLEPDILKAFIKGYVVGIQGRGQNDTKED